MHKNMLKLYIKKLKIKEMIFLMQLVKNKKGEPITPIINSPKKYLGPLLYVSKKILDITRQSGAPKRTRTQ